MVLLVVLSVHAGFEQRLKEMMLGFSPHLTVSSAYQGEAISRWEEMEKSLKEFPEVEGASALVEGFVLLDVRGWNSPVQFRGINTASDSQVEALAQMLQEGAVELDPQAESLNEIEEKGTADTAQGEGGAVISQLLANRLGLSVGDVVSLFHTSNLDQVMKAYRSQDKGRAYDEYPERFQPFEKLIGSMFTRQGDQEIAPTEKVTEAYRLIQDFVIDNGEDTLGIREVEFGLLEELLEMLGEPEGQEAGNDIYASGTQEMISAKLTELRELDLEKADLEGMKKMKDFVLPKELKVTGIYQDAQRARGPDVFVSLGIGQELRGLDDALVESIGIITSEPNSADLTEISLQKKLGDEWQVTSWMRRHSHQFQLVKTEKIMMSFSLSFITLLSAFSIMAVMYTMTVQKRQEIGVMKALGASPWQIVKVFLYQGLIVGIGGALLGVGLGRLVIHFRQNIVELIRLFGVDPFPADFHGITELPARIIPGYFVIVAVVAVILCLLAALVPALMAAFRDPAKSLRNL